jgi:hypothetical protein
MDQPNIAKVHDGGVTASGRPYFVMELLRVRFRHDLSSRLSPRPRVA